MTRPPWATTALRTELALAEWAAANGDDEKAQAQLRGVVDGLRKLGAAMVGEWREPGRVAVLDSGKRGNTRP